MSGAHGPVSPGRTKGGGKAFYSVVGLEDTKGREKGRRGEGGREERSRLSGLGGTGSAKTARSRDSRSVDGVLDRAGPAPWARPDRGKG